MKKEKYTRWNTATYILKDAWNYSHKMMAMMGLEVVIKAGALSERLFYLHLLSKV